MYKDYKALAAAVLLILSTACLSTIPQPESLKTPEKVIDVSDGGIIELGAGVIKGNINGKDIDMFAYNSHIPGPLIRVKEGSSIFVNLTNNLDVEAGPTTIHWHGIRLENRFDGFPELIQAPVRANKTFLYRLDFSDPGFYWYHSQVRQDMQQDLGLYGAILVAPENDDYYNIVNREEILVIDDLLLEDGDVYVFGQTISHALIGRFGNVMLVNGGTDYALNLDRGEVVRFYIVNVANTRVFNLSIPNAKIKLVGADVGSYAREFFQDSVIIAPGERYIAEVFFERPGIYEIKNINPVKSYNLGKVIVSTTDSENDYSSEFLNLRENPYVKTDLENQSAFFNKSVDAELWLSMERPKVNESIANETLLNETTEENAGLEEIPLERIIWEDTLGERNWNETNETLTWLFIDKETGKKNLAIGYTWNAGDMVRIRIVNDPASEHPTHHPIHFHGQRFLVLEEDSVKNQNLVWKDTVLVEAGAKVDILLDASNPGDWVAHCHTSEHLESGMKLVFRITPRGSVA